MLTRKFAEIDSTKRRIAVICHYLPIRIKTRTPRSYVESEKKKKKDKGNVVIEEISQLYNELTKNFSNFCDSFQLSGNGNVGKFPKCHP